MLLETLYWLIHGLIPFAKSVASAKCFLHTLRGNKQWPTSGIKMFQTVFAKFNWNQVTEKYDKVKQRSGCSKAAHGSTNHTGFCCSNLPQFHLYIPQIGFNSSCCYLDPIDFGVMWTASKLPKVHESNKVHDPDPERSCRNLTDCTWHSGYGAWRGGMWQGNIVF